LPGIERRQKPLQFEVMGALELDGEVRPLPSREQLESAFR
jgi:hypothetical protein